MEVKIALVSHLNAAFKNAGQIFAEHNKLIPEPDDGIQSPLSPKKWKSKAVTCRMPRSLICRDMMR